METPTQAISGFFLTTTSISYDGDHGHATGFFLKRNGTTYLITNKHAIDFKTHNDNSLRTVRIYIRPDPNDVEETSSRDLTLYSDGSNNWLKHDDFRVDIAAIPLKEPVVSEPIDVPSYDPIMNGHPSAEYNLGNLALSLDDLPSSQMIADGTMATVVRGGSQAMILGYPLYEPSNKMPVARSALISSPYGVSEQDQPFFRVDARTHDGLSGSPVLTTISEPTASVRVQDDGFDVSAAAKLLRDVEWNLIGIHAQSSDQTESLGLNDAYYPHLISEII